MAQGPDCYTFHVYVDPLYGDDALATAQNPPTGTPILGTHPDIPPPNQPIEGALTHAPYAFRTLTGPSGAVAWVAVRMPQIPAQFGTRFVEAVVIHCLPGLYGPRINGQAKEIDKYSGLPWNGEQFPVVLQDGVTLRGTSALDTILDARGQEVNVIEVAAPLAEDTHAADLITQLTIRGAITPAASHGGPLAGSLAGAGVYVHGRGRCNVTISNCFIVGNHVGIGVDAEIDQPPQSGELPHQVPIVNNTIAWNVVGIWNGNTGATPSVGLSHTPMLNNLVDHNGPGAPFPVGYSDFEGIDAADTTVLRIADQSGGTIVSLSYDTNAYSASLRNLGPALPPVILVWPETAPRVSSPSLPAIDLFGNGLAGPPGHPRDQVLFVADLLRQSPLAPGDYSPHDLRLAPRVRDLQGTWGTTPFVNSGLQTQAATAPAPPGKLFMVSGDEIPVLGGDGTAWGPGANMDDPAELHFWDWDAEGFGNPRMEPRTGYPFSPLLPAAAYPYATIDIGADELGDLILAGYLPNTRIFADVIPNASAATPHRLAFFVNYDPLNPTAPFSRPVMNVVAGGRYPDMGTPQIYYPWWPHVQDGTNAISSTVNYTEGAFVPGNPSERRVRVGMGRLPFMRNLFCDHSPHLILDPHPTWGKEWDNFAPIGRRGDIYATHPWMDSTTEGDLDNPFLFNNLRPPFTALNSSTQWFTGKHWSSVGIVNPPGTDGPATTGSFAWPNWLAGGYMTAPFGPFFPCQSGMGTQYVVDTTTGLGDVSANCPDQLPLVPDWFTLGVRINCEGRDVALVKNTNLQTFLMVIQTPPNDSGDGFEGTGNITEQTLRASRHARERR